MKDFILVLIVLAIIVAVFSYVPRKEFICNIRHCTVTCRNNQRIVIGDKDSIVFTPEEDGNYMHKTSEGVVLIYNPDDDNFYSRNCRLVEGEIEIRK